MTERLASHPFWGKDSPLTSLASLGLVLLASGRMAFALVSAAAYIWVAMGTSLIAFLLAAALPKRGRSVVLVLLATFFFVLFLLALTLLSPIMALEMTIPLLLVPIAFITSGVCSRLKGASLGPALARVLYEGVILGLILVALALIREPLGFGCLSVPDAQGVREVFGSEFAAGAAVRLFAGTSGALILLGYLVALFRSLRNLVADQAAPGSRE